MLDIKTVQPNQVLSRTEHYKVVETNNTHTKVINDDGMEITISNGIIEASMMGADTFSSEEIATKTAMAQIVFAHPRIAMTVCYNKQVKKKDVLDELMAAHTARSEAGRILPAKEMKKRINKAISRALEGEERVIRGRHYGHRDEQGRLSFIDADQEKKLTETKEGNMYDSRSRLVDPRTINWLIVNDVKYKLK